MVPQEPYNLMLESGKPSQLSTAPLGTARCCVLNEKFSSMGSHVDGAVSRGCGTFRWWNLGEEVSFKDVLYFLLAISLLPVHGRDTILSFLLSCLLSGGTFIPCELKARVNCLLQVAFSHGILFFTVMEK